MIDGKRRRIGVGDLVRGAFTGEGVFGMVTGLTSEQGRPAFEVIWYQPGMPNGMQSSYTWEADELELISSLGCDSDTEN